MRQHHRGQSLVEMALLMPLLLIILFGIIDMGYYVYSFAAVYQAVRNGAEQASVAPPFPSKALDGTLPDGTDPCVMAIQEAANGQLFLHDVTPYLQITYPEYVLDGVGGAPVAYEDRRELGYPIEVRVVEYKIEPLTPLSQLVPVFSEPGGGFSISASARRSIRSFGLDPGAENLSPCEE